MTLKSVNRTSEIVSLTVAEMISGNDVEVRSGTMRVNVETQSSWYRTPVHCNFAVCVWSFL